MFCPKCGSQRPDGDDFCAKCGASLRDAASAQASRPMKWEYKDVLVKCESKHSDDVIPNLNRALVQCLNDEGRDGWQPEGPTDATYLRQTKSPSGKPFQGACGARRRSMRRTIAA